MLRLGCIVIRHSLSLLAALVILVHLFNIQELRLPLSSDYVNGVVHMCNPIDFMHLELIDQTCMV